MTDAARGRTLADSTSLMWVGGRRLRVRDVPGGPPVLLLNGLGMPLELWEPLERQLAGRRLIAFDMPGVGRSPATDTPLEMAGYAALAARLLDAVGVRRADVIGLSFGGMVAQELAVRAPGRVRRLVLASTTCGWGGMPGSPLALLAILTTDRYLSQRLFESLAPLYLGGTDAADVAFLRRQGSIRTALPPQEDSYARQLWAAATWSSRPWLGAVSQPALVLAGTDDPLIPAVNARLLADLLPAAWCHLVPHGGHLCLLERAEEVAPLVEAFLADGGG